ncbi:gamma-glutamyl-gamma-aminobutyrate hydrolase family protein [Desulfotruncus alcoholivorax]|uniref:gamma-glutamyl-gamma-aminobutyrate hydrolase family protein n=1 Tax=Desulfotruncus alcoholivorax TaxID=265477 RepID=UPI0003FED4A7|nr:gamma-glutamyl-gamma-aminobutyrate hydrolase family protein [Desulfotruncus alcoholivorax]
MRPIIGITCSFDYSNNKFQLGGDYIEAVRSAGGIPLLLPHQESSIDEIINVIDGLLLSGGGDIDPCHISQEPWPQSGSIDPLRDAFELTITSRAIAEGMPVLGICRGMQVMNVAAGGDIHQDIYRSLPGAIKHSQDAPRWYPTHNIKIIKNTMLERILGLAELRVNSYHHQSINHVALGYRISAYSNDGVAEAIEGLGHEFTLGVQFHPENMFKRYPVMLNLFKCHIDASAHYLSTRSQNR